MLNTMLESLVSIYLNNISGVLSLLCLQTMSLGSSVVFLVKVEPWKLVSAL